MPKTYTNKLSIYLIKEEYSNPQDILKSVDSIESEEIGNIGTIYFGDSYINSPSWIQKFFGELFDNIKDGSAKERLRIFSATSKAAFVTTVENRSFVITFGYGHTLLKPGVWEERFGLKVILNTVDPENLRSIDKNNMSAVPKLSKEQISRDGTIADFGIDIEQDLIQGVTGKSKDDRFGQTITGKDALSVSVKFNALNIKDFLKLCLERYLSNDYKKYFAWTDQVAEIKDPNKINLLDRKLLEKINNGDFEKVWMAIPEIIPWENVAEFRVAGADASLGDDIYLADFVNLLTAEQKTELSIYKDKIIECIGASSNDVVKSWKAYNCLYCEINDDETYILSNGKWYGIESNFATQINNEFARIRDQARPSINFPSCRQNEHEDKYNERASRELNVCNMDRRTVNHGGAYSKIEFCDLLKSDKKIIHVKHYGASSVLSHLFAQGLVSSELFLSDREFRDKVRRKLPDEYKDIVPQVKPNPLDYEIIYAIISKSPDALEIPFFSKVNLRNAKRRLEAFGYSVSFLKIPTAE